MPYHYASDYERIHIIDNLAIRFGLGDGDFGSDSGFGCRRSLNWARIGRQIRYIAGTRPPDRISIDRSQLMRTSDVGVRRHDALTRMRKSQDGRLPYLVTF